MKIKLYLVICGLVFNLITTSGQNAAGLYFHISKGGCLVRQKGVYLISLNEKGEAYVVILSSGDIDILTETIYTIKNDTIDINNHGNFILRDLKIFSTINKRNKLYKANNMEINKLHKEYEQTLNKSHLTLNNGLIKKL